MRTPRNISGKELASRLSSLGYQPVRQRGSHLRIQTTQQGEHSVTIPLHDPIPIGTLKSILREVSTHFDITTEELLVRLGH